MMGSPRSRRMKKLNQALVIKSLLRKRLFCRCQDLPGARIGMR
jgi:hypothetical protein